MRDTSLGGGLRGWSQSWAPTQNDFWFVHPTLCTKRSKCHHFAILHLSVIKVVIGLPGSRSFNQNLDRPPSPNVGSIWQKELNCFASSSDFFHAALSKLFSSSYLSQRTRMYMNNTRVIRMLAILGICWIAEGSVLSERFATFVWRKPRLIEAVRFENSWGNKMGQESQTFFPTKCDAKSAWVAQSRKTCFKYWTWWIKLHYNPSVIDCFLLLWSMAFSCTKTGELNVLWKREKPVGRSYWMCDGRKVCSLWTCLPSCRRSQSSPVEPLRKGKRGRGTNQISQIHQKLFAQWHYEKEAVSTNNIKPNEWFSRWQNNCSSSALQLWCFPLSSIRRRNFCAINNAKGSSTFRYHTSIEVH